MSSIEFNKLQELKVSRAKRLLSILEHVGFAQISGEKDTVSKALVILSEHLPLLVKKIEAQKSLCVNNQCVALVDEELSLFTSRRKDLGGVSLLDHVFGAVKGSVELNVPVLVQALIVLLSRENSMPKLFNATIENNSLSNKKTA